MKFKAGNDFNVPSMSCSGAQRAGGSDSFSRGPEAGPERPPLMLSGKNAHNALSKVLPPPHSWTDFRCYFFPTAWKFLNLQGVYICSPPFNRWFKLYNSSALEKHRQRVWQRQHRNMGKCS